MVSFSCFGVRDFGDASLYVCSLYFMLPGLSDHDIVIAEVNSRPELIKQVPRDTPLYKKADWDQLKQSMRDFHTELL